MACSQFVFLERHDVLADAAVGATFLLDAPYPPDGVWDKLPVETQRRLIDKKIRFYVVDAHRVARNTGMGGRTNTILQTCFFALSGVLPREEAIEQIKLAIRKTYGKKGEHVVAANFAAVDAALATSTRSSCPRTRPRPTARSR